MSIVDKLRQESSSEHVAYTEFILKLSKNNSDLFCFFEGKDDYKYYGIRIQNILQRKFQSIHCGGKDHVIRLKKLIDGKKEYDNVFVSYFIDRDYDTHMELDNLYCLPSYSIENLYATKETLMKILNNEFSLNEDDADFNKAITLFQLLKDDFHSKVTLINAWLACQSDKKKALGIKTYLKIDDAIGAFFSSLIKNDLSSISDLSHLNDLDKIKSYFPKAPEISQDELETKLRIVKTENPDYYFRGKFEIKFFVVFLERLRSDIGKKKPLFFSVKHKCSLRFENATALTILSIYAETPPCLIGYLNLKKQKAA